MSSVIWKRGLYRHQADYFRVDRDPSQYIDVTKLTTSTAFRIGQDLERI